MPEVPAGITSVVVTGRYIRPDGTPLAGTVTFEPPAHLTIADADIMSMGAATATLDAYGAFSISLIATDDPGTQPSDWTYTVVERLRHVEGRTFPIALPGATPVVDLADISPTTPADGEYVVVTGPAGADGTQILTGTGAPPPAEGAGGDFYVDTTPGDPTLYGPKSADEWPSSGIALGRKPDKGVYVPRGWGEHWRSKRDAAGSGQARIVAVGGSSTAGWHASNLITTSWVGRVQAALQAQYGNGGSGFYPTSRSSTIISAASAIPVWQAAGCLVAQTGIWKSGTSYPGPGVTYIYTENTGSALTFKVTGQTVKIYTVAGPPPAGTRAPWTYSIDGGAPVTVQDAGGGTASIQVTTVSGLTGGEHTVTLTWAGTIDNVDQFFSVCGVSGENPTGVIVDNLSRPGATSALYAAQSSSVGAVWNGGASWSGDLAIYSAAPNDAAATTPVTGAQWETNLVSWIRAVKSANYNTDVLIALPHIGNYESAPIYHEYSARARTIAEAYGAALVNVWTLGKNSWDYWNSLGYWGTQTNPGGAGTDSVHPSDAGHQFIADTVLPILTS